MYTAVRPSADRSKNPAPPWGRATESRVRSGCASGCVALQPNSAAKTTAAAVAPIDTLFHGLATPAAAVDTPWRNDASPSAFAKSFAALKRSAGSFSSALRIAASTFAGIDLRSSAGETGPPEMIFPRTA